jgi:hypothetical protein
MITHKNLSTLNDDCINEIKSKIDEIGYTKTINICKLHDQLAVAQFVLAMYLSEFYIANILKKAHKYRK